MGRVPWLFAQSLSALREQLQTIDPDWELPVSISAGEPADDNPTMPHLSQDTTLSLRRYNDEG